MISHSHQDASHDTGRPMVISTTPARQGVTGHNVRFVLAVSLSAAIVALAAIALFYFSGN